jgi:aryl-alcohol dehydrogenase-like predicted oxidoreductase
MADRVWDGRVRCIGVSEPGAATIRRAHPVHPIIAVQIECALWTRDVESDILPVLGELGIQVVAYAPLGHGFLTDHARNRQSLPNADFRHSQPRFSEENRRKCVGSIAIMQVAP